MRYLVTHTRALLCYGTGNSSISSSATPAPSLTRLGPSGRVPGTVGVFAAALIKKHTPLEVVPSRPLGVSLSSSTSSVPLQAAVEAPPYVCNLVTAPRRTVSLRRFLALRAHFSDRRGRFLHAATPQGWFLLLPSDAVPIADRQGLEEWRRTHHHRYTWTGGGGGGRRSDGGNTDASRSSGSRCGHLTNEQETGTNRGGGKPSSPEELRRSKAGALARQHRAWVGLRTPGEGIADGGQGDGNDNDNDSGDGLELSAAELQQMVWEMREAAARDRAAGAQVADDARADDNDNEDDDDDDDDGDGVGEVVGEEDADNATEPALASAAAAPQPTAATSTSHSVVHDPFAPLRRDPLTIPESHLFEINDGVPWPLPPADDLADPTYWQHHRERMAVYESTGGLSAADRADFLADTIQGAAGVDNAPPSASSSSLTQQQQQQQLSERERYEHGAQVFDALTRKANVTVEVIERRRVVSDDDDGSRRGGVVPLVTLKPLVDLHPGDELLLHYGREWWSERLLATLFLAAADDELKSVRWIEALFSGPTDVAASFPLLAPAYKKTKKTTKRNNKTKRSNIGNGGEHDGSSEASVSGGQLVLYNKSTRKEATDAEALAAAIRLSCTSAEFLSLLISGPTPNDNTAPPSSAAASPNAAANASAAPVFSQRHPDGEVPIDRLRKALAHALQGYSRGGDGAYDMRPLPEWSAVGIGSSAGRTHSGGVQDGDADEDDDIFKI